MLFILVRGFIASVMQNNNEGVNKLLPDDAPVLLRMELLAKVLGLSKATIYTWVRKGSFPAPIVLSVGAVAWRKVDVETWFASKTERSADCRSPGRPSKSVATPMSEAGALAVDATDTRLPSVADAPRKRGRPPKLASVQAPDAGATK